MLKKGKKVLLLILAFALAIALFAGCSGGMTASQVNYSETEGAKGGAVTSNGGFVVQKGEGDNAWFYFINGVETSSSDNTYGSVGKGALMRISKKDLDAGNNAAETVVPELMVAGDYTAGLFIYGDYVYYATPNTLRNLDGEVESDYLNFRRASLDGSAMTDYYVQVSSNTTEYRFVEENGVVYLLYLDSTDSEIHSYNTQSRVDTVLAKGYTAAEFDDSDPENPVVYYTMPVTTPNTYDAASAAGSTEDYNQLYRVTASATESPYGELDLSEYTDDSVSESDENYQMEYINLGELVLDGIGIARKDFVTPFNHDLKNDDGTADLSAIKTLGNGFTYSILRYANGQVILSVTELVDSSVRAYALDDEDTAAETWNSVSANPSFEVEPGGLTAISLSTTNIANTTFFYKDGEDQYYIYVDDSGNITRVRVGTDPDTGYIDGSPVILARGKSGAAIVSADPINGTDPAFLYYSVTGTNGLNLYRIQYNGTQEDYYTIPSSESDKNFTATQYLAIDYNSSWYKPEMLGGYLFFANAESYSENYVYVMENPSGNAALETVNEQYQAVNDLFTEMDTDFGDAANLARYYYYGGDLDTVRDETGEHYDQYQAEDFEVLDAFINCAGPDSTEYKSHGFDFSVLKTGDGDTAAVYNTRNSFYKLLGQVSESDAETIDDNLIADLVLSETDEETSDAWTWQWAAIFVPVGVVVIAGAVVAVVLIRRKRK